MELVLKATLARLEAAELAKPEEERRHVPTPAEIANAIGVHRVTVYGYLSGDVIRFDLNRGAKILDYLNSLGFEVDESDLVKYRPPVQP